MSGNSKNSSKTPHTATIKIAPSEQSQRKSTADVGPGDPNAAPSVVPELVDIPAPPTPSELVVKSSSGKLATTPKLATLNEAARSTSAPKSTMASGSPGNSVMGSKAGPAASNVSQAPREATSSRPLTGPPSVGGASSAHSGGSSAHSGGAGGVSGSAGGVSGSAGGAGGAAGAGGSGLGNGASSVYGNSGSRASGASPNSAAPSSPAELSSPASAQSSQKSRSTSPMSDGSGVVHDEDEVGEGELEHPSGLGAAKTVQSGHSNTSGIPSNSGAGGSQKTEASASGATGGMSTGGGISNLLKTDNSKDKKKKVTKFRYHKRITVRTTGKTSPAAVMDKVNKKARITPSTIEDLDPQELMKRAGIKGTKQTHWRVRLRQTKRITKNGQTTTQTKVAYRDSEGNKRVRTSDDPNCKKCGKKLEECKCDTNSQS